MFVPTSMDLKDIITESAVYEPITESIDELINYTKERSDNVKIVADMFKLDSIECSLCENATRMNIRIDNETTVNIPIEAGINMQYADILSSLKTKKK